MGWRDGISKFDLGRLTPLGWLVLLLSVAAGIAVALIVGPYEDELFRRQPGDNGRRYTLAGLVGAVVPVGCFFAMRGLLYLLGIRIVLPSMEESAAAGKEGLDQLRRRARSAKRWSLFFLLLIPVGFLIPCGTALALAPPAGTPLPEGITPPQVCAMIALGLPLVSLIAWIVMRSIAQECAQAVVTAEQADEVRKPREQTGPGWRRF
jgi:hypothetical protein